MVTTPRGDDGIRSQRVNKAAWLEALAALELELAAYRNKDSFRIGGDSAPATLDTTAEAAS
jgi:hypothetical protein